MHDKRIPTLHWLKHDSKNITDKFVLTSKNEVQECAWRQILSEVKVVFIGSTEYKWTNRKLTCDVTWARIRINRKSLSLNKSTNFEGIYSDFNSYESYLSYRQYYIILSFSLQSICKYFTYQAIYPRDENYLLKSKKNIMAGLSSR